MTTVCVLSGEGTLSRQFVKVKERERERKLMMMTTSRKEREREKRAKGQMAKVINNLIYIILFTWNV